MAVSNGRKWNNSGTYSANARIHTRVIDFDDSTTAKDVFRILIGIGGFSTSVLTVVAHYRFTTGGDDIDSGWKLFGVGSGIPEGGQNIEIMPASSTFTDIETTIYTHTNGTEESFKKLANVYIVQFKFTYIYSANSVEAHDFKNAIELNDINIEYRLRRNVSISGPSTGE